MRLRTELNFCRTHFDSYFSYSTNLLTLLYFIILHYTILYYTIFYYTILYHTIIYYIYYTIIFLGQKVVPCLLELMLESQIKQFYHPRPEDSSIKAYDKSRIYWISCCWFCIYFKRHYFETPSDDCFCNVRKIFLTTTMYTTTRDAFTAAKNLHRIGLKRYLMNRSSRVLLIFLF